MGLKLGPYELSWLGHASFLLKDGKVIYVDPYEIVSGPKADIILITHDHFDHCSPEDISRLLKDSTKIVAPASCRGKVLGGELLEVRPGDRIELDDIKIEVVPAYNVRQERLRFHPKESGYVGYVLELPDGTRVYHAGDTDLIPEMRDLRVDIALVPVSGTYVMDASEAAEAVETIKPKVAVPMHYGAIVGSRADAERFRELVRSCEVKILEKE